jgi:drug/metabolite transporter (DMT)-like permease
MGTIGMSLTRSQWVLPIHWTWLVTLLFIGLFGFFAQVNRTIPQLCPRRAYVWGKLISKLFLTVGLQHETASRGTLAMYIQIVFTVTFEYLAFGTIPSTLSVAGATVIIASAVYVAVRTLLIGPLSDVVLNRLSLRFVVEQSESNSTPRG